LISQPFLVGLALTVLALAAVIWSGVARRRSLHYGLVVGMLGLLTWTIREAEVMGSLLVFDGTAAVFRTIHFVAVSATFLALPVLVVTGVRLARQETPGHRRRHRALAWVFVGCVLTTTALGTAMTLLATKAEDVPATAGSPAGE
jgi:hypothetical protein